MKKIFFLFILLFTQVTQAQMRCDIMFKQNEVCAQIDWTYGPFLDQNNSAKLSLSSSEKFDQIKVIPWMVMHSHEHGSRPIKLTNLGNNEYLIENAYFMGGMDGLWFFKIQLLKANQLIEENRYPIKF